MGFFSHDSDEAQAYEQVTNAPHKAALSHELIAAAASFEVRIPVPLPLCRAAGPCPCLGADGPCVQAAKAYEKHCKEEGKPESHAVAKELLAGFAGAFVDRMVETKGVRPLPCDHWL
ncbi:hypothetical protein B0H11DRAFT_2035243 [Mycena galericulata]|nr:hypothetical protein B0H11DRAFT_2035243 [Mycena galericulata]